MKAISDAFRKAIMPKHEYQNLRDEDKAFLKLQRPICFIILCFLVAIVISTAISSKIMFPGDSGDRHFCYGAGIQALPINASSEPADSEAFPGAFYLTDQETVDYYYTVLFWPSLILFIVSFVHLVAGIMVASSAPPRHGCLNVIESKYCGSERGGVHCLAILNIVFAIVFGLFAILLGSSLLTVDSSCSLPLFWCYEVVSWGLVILYEGTAIFLRRRSVIILDEGSFSGRNMGFEMVGANPSEISANIEQLANEPFQTWMGPSLLSSDDEDDPDEYAEISRTSFTVSVRAGQDHHHDSSSNYDSLTAL